MDALEFVRGSNMLYICSRSNRDRPLRGWKCFVGLCGTRTFGISLSAMFMLGKGCRGVRCREVPDPGTSYMYD